MVVHRRFFHFAGFKISSNLNLQMKFKKRNADKFQNIFTVKMILVLKPICNLSKTGEDISLCFNSWWLLSDFQVNKYDFSRYCSWWQRASSSTTTPCCYYLAHAHNAVQATSELGLVSSCSLYVYGLIYLGGILWTRSFGSCSCFRLLWEYV